MLKLKDKARQLGLDKLFNCIGESEECAISVGVILSVLGRLSRPPRFLWVSQLCTFRYDRDWENLPLIYALSSSCVMLSKHLHCSDFIYTADTQKSDQIVRDTCMSLQLTKAGMRLTYISFSWY